MNYLTTKSVLDRVSTRIKDQSSTMRVKMLAWLNSLMQDVINEPRDWQFLHKSATLTLTANTATLPTDFGDEIFIQTGIYTLTVGERLSPEDAALIDQAGGDPAGYTLTPTTVTIHPSASGTITLKYKAAFPSTDYLDDITATLFPAEWLPVFERALLAAFYEYDVDADRLPVGLQISADQMRKMKALDNQRRPLPQLNHKGMLR